MILSFFYKNVFLPRKRAKGAKVGGAVGQNQLFGILLNIVSLDFYSYLITNKLFLELSHESFTVTSLQTNFSYNCLIRLYSYFITNKLFLELSHQIFTVTSLRTNFFQNCLIRALQLLHYKQTFLRIVSLDFYSYFITNKLFLELSHQIFTVTSLRTNISENCLIRFLQLLHYEQTFLRIV